MARRPQPRPPGIVIANSQARSTVSRHQFPANLGAHGVVFVFREYTYGGGGKITGSVVLPIPRNIVDTYIVGVDRAELGILGAAAVDVVKAASTGVDINRLARNAGADAYDALRGMVNSGTGAIASDAAAAAKFIARAGLTNIPGLGAISSAVDVTAASAINPHATVVFEGIGLKNFTFDWQFAPTSQSDSTKLRDLINTVKRASLPEYGNLAGQTGGSTGTFLDRALLKYPQMVDINFFGIDQDYFIRYKTCMIKSLNVDYSGQSGPVLVAGTSGSRPAFVNLVMELIETEIHTRADVTADGEGF